MKRFFQNKITIFALISLLALAFFYGTGKVSAVDRSTYKNLKTFNEVLDMVEKNYVEEVKLQDLIQGAISGMIKSLDPHSTFMNADEYKELEVETKGSFGGIGIEITILRDMLTVVSPIEDTPAYQAGIKPGDQIIKIDGKSTKDITIQEAVKKLRGPKDTKVTVTILRESLPKPKDYVLTRAIIKVTSVKSRLMDDGIGYCRITSFQERTADDLKKAIQDMESKVKPLKGIILDLRNNPGGLLNQSIEVADVFLKTGTIVSTRGRIKVMETSAAAKNDGDEPLCPIVVLVNEGSASASEIVAGALQDNNRALILGTQTFGKGSVQTLIPLEDGAALKLTTAKYYTPSGRSIQAEGIVPDITLKYAKTVEDVGENDNAMREKDLERHIKSAKENGEKPDEMAPAAKKEAEDAAFAQDNQVKAASDMLKSWHIFMKGKKN
ncbi:MAG: S41 family peptidase [Syntrophales bacterium]|jgi:carboxyl-terminal processing protease|nr:S41 family peptidase [Syntrophales bacterium]NLN59215.1 S41 family peptidase [Deltaproteobacteria bacterium]